jgi:hypothetical protein
VQGEAATALAELCGKSEIQRAGLQDVHKTVTIIHHNPRSVFEPGYNSK